MQNERNPQFQIKVSTEYVHCYVLNALSKYNSFYKRNKNIYTRNYIQNGITKFILYIKDMAKMSYAGIDVFLCYAVYY